MNNAIIFGELAGMQARSDTTQPLYFCINHKGQSVQAYCTGRAAEVMETAAPGTALAVTGKVTGQGVQAENITLMR